MVDKQKSLQDLRQERVKANGGILSNLFKTKGVEEPLREAPVPDTSRPRPLTTEENAASHGMKPLTKEQSELATGRKLTPEENALTHTGNLTAFDRSQSIANKINASGSTSVDEEEEVVPESEFGVVDYNADPENDPSLFEPALFSDAAYDYWNTAEPAEPEERSLFESPSFQQSALTFGLTLMMGGSFQDAMYNGGEAFARTEYKNTDEYKKMANMGIPSYLIEDSYISGDTKALNDFYNSTVAAAQQKEAAKKLAAERAGLVVDPNSMAGKRLQAFDKEAQIVYAEEEAMARKLAAYNPDASQDGLTQLMNMYELIQGLDDSTVKEGELRLFSLLQPSLPAGIKTLEQFFSLDPDKVNEMFTPGVASRIAGQLQKNLQSKLNDKRNRLVTLEKNALSSGINQQHIWWTDNQRVFGPQGPAPTNKAGVSIY